MWRFFRPLLLFLLVALSGSRSAADSVDGDCCDSDSRRIDVSSLVDRAFSLPGDLFTFRSATVDSGGLLREADFVYRDSIGYFHHLRYQHSFSSSRKVNERGSYEMKARRRVFVRVMASSPSFSVNDSLKASEEVFLDLGGDGVLDLVDTTKVSPSVSPETDPPSDSDALAGDEAQQSRYRHLLRVFEWFVDSSEGSELPKQ